MSRIIAGFAGSLKLTVPTSGTRPTSDRVREAIFSALDMRGAIEGARVLDLYAGTGALGLEAASRGAREVTLVEKSGSATKACRDNAAIVLRAAPADSVLTIEVSGQAVHSFLAGSAATWDLVFLDPPYELGLLEISQALYTLVSHLSADAVLVLERSSRTQPPTWPRGLTFDRRKDYGDTTLYWLRKV